MHYANDGLFRQPLTSSFGLLLRLITIAAIVFLYGLIGILFLSNVLYLSYCLAHRRWQLASFVPLLVLVVTVGIVFTVPRIPTNTEWQFRQHREEYVKLADAAIKNGYVVPPSNLYRKAEVSRSAGASTVVGFVVDNPFLHLVFIDDDDPESAYPICTRGGAPLRHLEPQWYICWSDQPSRME